ncbi:MAG: hypothetical protein LKI93_05045 [Bifidobacteriaceae bacterium]|nr:hypothetical protein [Bifidobacteriaceae bacterium]MCI1914450.1 hypothetical protein [Bifidobacteriaceae bacterium]
MVITGLCGGVSSASVPPVSAAEATYPATTVVSYGIPGDVVQVICDNSRMADGKAPCDDGITAATMTLADVAQMTVFSVANRTKSTDADDVASSTPNATVATWAKDVVDRAAATWVKNATNAQRVVTDDESRVKSDAVLRYDLWTDASVSQKILTDGVPKYSGGLGAANSWNTPTPVFNVLMALANSATNATTIDLTGLLSKVDLSATTYPGVRLKLLSLLQGKSLAKLTTLKLGYNGIGIDSQACANSGSVDDCTDSAENWFRSGPLAAPSLDALYLDNNDIHAIDATMLSDAAQTVTKLYLSGNDLSTLNYNNGQFFQSILNNPDSVLDLSGNLSINEEDKNTLFVLEKAIETNGAAITIEQSVLSATLIAAIADTTWCGTLSVKGLESVADRIDTSVLSAWLAYSADPTNKCAPLTPTTEILDAIMEKSTASVEGLSEQDKKNLQTMIDSTTDAGVKEALERMLEIANSASASSIEVSGTLDFGSVSIEDLYAGAPVESASTLTMKGTLEANQKLTVEESPWVSASGTSFTPELSLQLSGVFGALTVNSTVDLTSHSPVDVVPVSSSSAVNSGTRDFDLSVDKAALTGLPATLTAGQYTGSLTWSLVAGP